MKTLKEIRKSKGLTIQQVANDIGMSWTFIDRVEKGEKVSHEKVCDYAHYLGVELLPIEVKESYLTSYERENNQVTKMTVDYFNGTEIIFDLINKSVVRYYFGIVREVYDFEVLSNLDNLEEFLQSYL